MWVFLIISVVLKPTVSFCIHHANIVPKGQGQGQFLHSSEVLPFPPLLVTSHCLLPLSPFWFPKPRLSYWALMELSVQVLSLDRHNHTEGERKEMWLQRSACTWTKAAQLMYVKVKNGAL